MHLLFIALVSIFAGTWLLAKTKKEELTRFFTYISWFFIVVGFIVFAGFVAGGICKMSHCGKAGQSCCGHEMMMKGCHPGMHSGSCTTDKDAGCCEEKGNCKEMGSDGKCCPEQSKSDSSKMCCPEPKPVVK